MKRQTIRKKVAYILIIGSIAGYAAAQGSLTPPGAPGATMKTLEQVEPRTDVATVAGDATYHHVITSAGSYYLSGNLAVTNTSGIHINAAGVTLDLNGFQISRTSGSGGYGILNIGTPGVTVRNGTIVGFEYGIQTWGACLLEKLIVSECSSYGIHAGSDSRIIDCQAHNNAGSGIYAIQRSVLNGCLATYNGGTYGIYAGDGSSLNSCIASHNTGDYGIYAGSGSSLSGCTASYNSGDGIYADSGSSLNNCTASYNSGLRGIQANDGASVRGCTVYDNQAWIGIDVDDGSSVSGCTVYNNQGTYSSSSYGIYAGNGSTVSECTVRSNSNTNSPSSYRQGTGIFVNGAGTVKNCTVTDNTGDGIRVRNTSFVTGNTCDYNGYSSGDGAGIHVTGSNTRIDGNTVTGNDRGIQAVFTNSNANLIIRNSASDNTTSDYDIAPGNKTGTIQTTPVGAGPWDNFQF